MEEGELRKRREGRKVEEEKGKTGMRKKRRTIERKNLRRGGGRSRSRSRGEERRGRETEMRNKDKEK